ncbi:hypothetical protein KM043_016895 [Ampulex compressa]|nr:hypothetical protein KM043_016895 [Ampulex compressa]
MKASIEHNTSGTDCYLAIKRKVKGRPWPIGYKFDYLWRESGLKILTLPVRDTLSRLVRFLLVHGCCVCDRTDECGATTEEELEVIAHDAFVQSPIGRERRPRKFCRTVFIPRS